MRTKKNPIHSEVPTTRTVTDFDPFEINSSYVDAKKHIKEASAYSLKDISKYGAVVWIEFGRTGRKPMQLTKKKIPWGEILRVIFNMEPHYLHDKKAKKNHMIDELMKHGLIIIDKSHYEGTLTSPGKYHANPRNYKTPMTFNKAHNLFEDRRNKKKDSVKLRGSNTWLVQTDDGKGYAIKYHQTKIVNIYPGEIMLDSGGWKTVTTKAKMNEFLPENCYVSQRKGEWYLNDMVYMDGMIINSNDCKLKFYSIDPKTGQKRKNLIKWMKGNPTRSNPSAFEQTRIHFPVMDHAEKVGMNAYKKAIAMGLDKKKAMIAKMKAMQTASKQFPNLRAPLRSNPKSKSDKIVGYKNGKPIYEEKLKLAMRAHNSNKEFPTFNEAYNEDKKLGDAFHRGIVRQVENSKYGMIGKGKVSEKDIKDLFPLLFNQHYGSVKSNPIKSNPFIIIDWAGNLKFDGKTFEDFDQADEYLTKRIYKLYPDTIKNEERFSEERGEYYIETKKPSHSRSKKYLDPKDPRNPRSNPRNPKSNPVFKGKNSIDENDCHLIEAGYIEAALWTSLENYDDETYLDANYSMDDLSEEAHEKISQDINDFVKKASPVLKFTGPDMSYVGHDLWLTRNGHGAGFWDRPEMYGKSGSEKLSKIASDMGEITLYAGDDGKLYIS